MSDQKSDDKNVSVVVALFENAAAAEGAVNGLKAWDGANDEVKLGAIGTVAKVDGKLKTNVGRKTGKGATVGATVGVIAGVLSGGLTLVAGALAGAVGGGALGTFMKKSLNLTKEEIEALGPELDAGKVAVVVSCDEAEVAETQTWLTNAGGSVNSYAVPTAAISEAIDSGVGADVPVAPAVDAAAVEGEVPAVAASDEETAATA